MLHVVNPRAGLWRKVDGRGLLSSQNLQLQVQVKPLSQKTGLREIENAT